MYILVIIMLYQNTQKYTNEISCCFIDIIDNKLLTFHGFHFLITYLYIKKEEDHRNAH